MKKVFIKYNPYSLETEISVEGKALADNSVLKEKAASGTRLQEWIEDLPDILIDELNDNAFDITFHGTLLDYEDLADVFRDASEKEDLTVNLDRIPAKETSDKEELIAKVFEKIQKGPYEELRSNDIVEAFESAKSSDFPVCVIATMSAGKSTLINAMLRDKMMPSKQEACTAIITKLRDDDNPKWKAEVFNKAGEQISTYDNLSYEDMVKLNGDENVSSIDASGNIPFVTAEDVSLVLIDTPGPNNHRDPEHKRIQSEFLNKSSKTLVLYIMEGTFGSDDDDALLSRVAESMSVGGKQSKDRFIFVVNKMDDRKKEDGDTEQTLSRVRTYLDDHNIKNPNIFPAAALPALNIRRIMAGVEDDEDTIDETEVKIRKLNRNENLHFEKYAPLPNSIKKNIEADLQTAIENDDDKEQALIHTGIVSIEAAIRQYVQKYAKTAKIKNIVDTFTHKLDELGCYDETKKELASRQDEGDKIIAQISLIEKKVDDLQAAKQFQGSVDDAVVKIDDDVKVAVRSIIKQYVQKMSAKAIELRETELELDKLDEEQKALQKFADNLEPAFQNDLKEIIDKDLISTSNALLEEYKKKLRSLTDVVDQKAFKGMPKIDPLRLMSGSLTSATDISLDGHIRTKQVEDGVRWVKNDDKKWYKPWTWFQPSKISIPKYKDVSYVMADEFAQSYFSSIETAMRTNGKEAEKHARKESLKIANDYKARFKLLDDALKGKLAELKDYASNKEAAEARIRECEDRLKWLDDIKAEVNSILEI